jgi:hypothetical protein
MSLKLHFLESRLDYFPPNLGAVSEEQGERFHRVLKDIERHNFSWIYSNFALIKSNFPGCIYTLQSQFFPSIFFSRFLTKLCMDNPVIFVSSRVSNLNALLAKMV